MADGAAKRATGSAADAGPEDPPTRGGMAKTTEAVTKEREGPEGGPRSETGVTRREGATTRRPPYAWAALAAGLVFALYALTLAPTTAFWDTSEYIATGHILGIPHPPGNPLFVLLARTWDVLLSFTGLSTAVKINLFSATMSALAHGLWFLVAHRILSYFSDDRRFTLVGAFASVLIAATAFTVWNQSNVNEKVYTVSLFTIALLTWLAFRWREHLGEGKDDNLLVLMVFILALSVGNHLMAFLAAPALVVFILFVKPETFLNWRLYAAGAVVVVLGLSVHLFLPIRAGLDPVINEADPTCRDIPSAVVSTMTWGQAGCEELSAALAREQYDKPPLIPRQAPLHAQFGNYFQYFDWQWARSLSGTDTLFAQARLPFTFLFTFLGVYGAARHYRRDRTSWAYVTVLFATLSVALVYYLNFKYGYTFASPTEEQGAHEVRERDYFFIVSFSLWGVWAGIGLAALWRALGERLGGLGRSAPVLAVAFLPLVLNWSWADRSHDYSARDWAYNLLMSVEPYAILFTNGDNDTFPLWYLQEVEGIRRDVTVVVTSYLNTDWYVKQLRELTRPCGSGEDPNDDPTRILCQRPYTAENTGAMYTADPARAEAEGKVPLVVRDPIRPPSRPVIELEDETVDRVARSYAPVDETRSYRLGNVRATLRAGSYLLPWNQFALAMINTSIGDRPIYFASSGNTAESLGLSPYLVREGLAFRLHNGELSEETAPSEYVPIRAAGFRSVTGPWLHASRTRKLLWEVFEHRSGIPDEWGHWPDHSTIGIPNYYAWGHYALAQAAAEEGIEGLEAPRNRERAEAWAILGTP